MGVRGLILLCGLGAAAVYQATRRRPRMTKSLGPTSHALSDRTALVLASEVGLPPVVYRSLFSGQRCLVCFSDPAAPRRCEIVECRVSGIDASTGAPEVRVEGYPRRHHYHGVSHGDSFRLRAPGAGSIEEDVGIFATIE